MGGWERRRLVRGSGRGEGGKCEGTARRGNRGEKGWRLGRKEGWRRGRLQ